MSFMCQGFYCTSPFLTRGHTISLIILLALTLSFPFFPDYSWVLGASDFYYYLTSEGIHMSAQLPSSFALGQYIDAGKVYDNSYQLYWTEVFGV